MPLAAGSKAPDFTLHDAPHSSVSLSDLLGRPTVLVFYVADWHPVSTDQLIQLARDASSRPHRRELDMLVTAGERISMAVLSMVIHDAGVEAIAYGTSIDRSGVTLGPALPVQA